jgi:hypothetical protein
MSVTKNHQLACEHHYHYKRVHYFLLSNENIYNYLFVKYRDEQYLSM